MSIGLQIEGVSFDVDALKARPQHAAVLGRIFTSWSLIEGTIAALLGLMMHADERAALAVLQTFHNNHARVDAVRKVGAEMLAEEFKGDFDNLMKEVLNYATERNAIAHHLWGVCDDKPALVYRIPMSAVCGIVVKSPAMDVKKINEYLDLIKAKMDTFTLAELEQIEQQGQDILRRVMSETTKKAFNQAATAQPPHPT